MAVSDNSMAWVDSLPEVGERSVANRRRFLQAVGVGGVIGLAGCVGVQDGDGTAGGGGQPEQTTTEGDGGTAGTTTGEPMGPEQITLGQPASLTGKWDFLQPAVSQSTDLALQEINDAGGPLGATVELERRDTAVSPQQARTVVRQLKNNDGAVAILGLFSS